MLCPLLCVVLSTIGTSTSMWTKGTASPLQANPLSFLLVNPIVIIMLLWHHARLSILSTGQQVSTHLQLQGSRGNRKYLLFSKSGSVTSSSPVSTHPACQQLTNVLRPCGVVVET